MPFNPKPPFPKSRGDVINSTDWNDVVTEIQRLDTDKVNKAGDAMTGPLTISGNLGIGTNSPQSKLHVAGGQWDLTNSEGDLKIGDGTNRLKIGVATGGGGAGDVRIRAQGGTNRLMLGSGTSDVLTIQGSNVGIGKVQPGAKLEVVADSTTWGGWYEAIRFGQSAHSAITHPGGGLLFGLHSDRRFYFADMNEGQYIMTVDANPVGGGSVGIGTTSPYTQLTLTGSLGFTNATTPMMYIFQSGTNNPERPIISHSPSFSNWGLSYRDADDKMIFQSNGSPVMTVALGAQRVGIGTTDPGETLTVNGTVRLGAGGQQVFIGGNATGPILRLNDDLWFSDPQNGTIQLRNSNDSNWGTLVGIFTNVSSIEHKKDVSLLQESELEQLLDDSLKTNLVKFRYKGDEDTHRLRLGVILEDCPSYLVAQDGESLTISEYISMLHGAIKALAKKVEILEGKSEP